MVAQQRFPWIAVSAVAAVAIISAAAWMEVPDGVRPSASASRQPALELTRVDVGASEAVLAEKLAAYDPTPLFLPSAMNAELPSPPATRDDVAGPFAPLAPSLVKNAPMHFPALVAIPQSPVGGLRLTERAESALVLARRDLAGAGLDGRSGQVEAVDVATGQVAYVGNLSDVTGPQADDWQPLELIGAVSRSGVVGKLVVTRSSGSDRVDEYFQSHLMVQARIEARLPEGIYLFRVGP